MREGKTFNVPDLSPWPIKNAPKPRFFTLPNDSFAKEVYYLHDNYYMRVSLRAIDKEIMKEVALNGALFEAASAPQSLIMMLYKNSCKEIIQELANTL